MRTIEKLLKKTESYKEKARISLIDFIRGFAIIVMVIFHMFFTFGQVFDFAVSKSLYLFFESIAIVEIFAALFIIISGISSSLTSSNIRRGIRTLSIAMGITLVTSFIMPLLGYDRLQISFGILHLLGLCMIASPLFLKLSEQVPAQTAVPLCVFLLILTRNISSGYIGLGENFASFKIPPSIMDAPFLFPFGIKGQGFFSADYYPIFPWIFLFIIGIYAGRQIKNMQLPPNLYKPINRPIEYLGQRTLTIYILHQPVIFLLGLLIQKLASLY